MDISSSTVVDKIFTFRCILIKLSTNFNVRLSSEMYNIPFKIKAMCLNSVYIIPSDCALSTVEEAMVILHM